MDRTISLEQPNFPAMVALAAMMHALAWFAWSALPHAPAISVPVRALNIKLGDSKDVELDSGAQDSLQPGANNSENVENALAQLVRPDRDKARDDLRVRAVLRSMERAMASLAPVSQEEDGAKADAGNLVNQSVAKIAQLGAIAKQFVRARGAEAPNASSKAQGSALGNSTAGNAEALARYEQMISLWIKKFQVYPKVDRSQVVHWDTVVRIRIDRQGTVRYYALERSTGSAVLDQAALNMIKRANPMPPVPQDYPAGALIEFLLPVSFKLD